MPSKPALIRCLIPLAFLLLSACGQLPEHLKRQAGSLTAALAEGEASLGRAEHALAELQGSEDWSFLSPYAEREQWAQALVDAGISLEQARALHSGTIARIVAEDDPDDTGRLREQLSQLESLMEHAREIATSTVERGQVLLRTRDQAPEIHAKAGTEHKRASALTAALHDRLNELGQAYPDKRPDLAARGAEADQLLAEVTAQLAIVDAQHRNIPAGTADYALLHDAARSLGGALAEVEAFDERTRTKVGELDRTLIRILSDQKIEYFAVVGRASWCDGDECYGESTHLYPPVQVTASVIEALDSFGAGNLAEFRSGFFSDDFRVRIDRRVWDSLQVDGRQGWNPAHDSVDFWYESGDGRAYHRYTEIVDGADELTAWIPVSEDLYWAHQEHLGMALVSKPVGLYAEEAITTPEPVGSSLIAEPTLVDGQPTGRNRYGYWEGGFWHYYGQYRLVGDLVGGRYRYDHWDGYSRRDRSRPYYGRESQWGTYGASTYEQERYRNSSYARRNPDEIAYARDPSRSSAGRQDPSVRGAGRSSSGRGPGGGGK